MPGCISKSSTTLKTQPDTSPVIFYDGTCGLCDKSVQFVLRHDRKQVFRFATLQGDYADKVLGPGHSSESFVLLEGDKQYNQSTAALRTFRALGSPWNWLYVFILVPAFIRNAVYRFVARNRYKWFGRYESCRIPSAEEKKRFIE